ncbi:MAG: von Willebrand factor type A domain-containing protein [Planctomycetes bacterium]|nr:von Willebrand factor type A domain-containing protein [Planctomycetota bacterium]MCW8136382.1 von Willebrand factor type A domain-containing protein [Planctomycetota bacterium]
MQDHDPILESALEEALGGKSPPDLIAATLAKAAALPPAAKAPLTVKPRPHWRAWGTGLASAAALVIGVGVFALNGDDKVAPNSIASHAKEEKEAGCNSDQSQALVLDGIRFSTPESVLTGKEPGQFFRDHSPTDNMRKLTAPDAADGPQGMIHKGHGYNPFVDTEDDAKSTFALEHDTGSYTLTRAYLGRGVLPPEEAIRPEEFLNYFSYGYATPVRDPFIITMDGAPSRYGADIRNSYLLRVGVQARRIDPAERKAATLTLLIDTSGSMSGDNRLGMVKRALAMLVNELREGDRVAIVTFESGARVVLEHRDAGRKSEILDAIDGLQASGSTNAEQGLKLAYELAAKAYRAGSTNRVVLCSDGVANTGISDVSGLLREIVSRRRAGITLSSLGFGMDNVNDHLLEQLGDKGDGHYAYIDSLDEAKRVFVDNLTGALEVVGRDVKIQVEFNPTVVKSYRLIGYVNRDVKDEDFRNDAVDGGEIGAGHAATALYEIKLHDNAAGHVATATVRYKLDEEGQAQEISQQAYTQDLAREWTLAPLGLRLAGNVAEFAEILANGFYARGATLEPVIADLEQIVPEWREEQVNELLKLVRKAAELKKD